MATITTRAGKGSPLTNTEVDNNFTDINTELGQKESASNKGVANGYASLDGSGKVPSTQLPSYVDDVVEGANLAALPATGETGKIYVTLDTNKTYRWSGSAYVEISASPGSTDAVTEGSTNLYFTNARARSAISATGSLSYNSTTGVMSFTDAVTSVAGKTGAVTLTNSDVGLGNVENKSSATIRGELTSSNVTTALGFTPASKAGDTFTGPVLLTQNPVGTTYGNGVSATPTYYLGQGAGNDDAWKIYGESDGANQVRLVFETNDDNDANEKFLFRYKKTYGDFAATDLLAFDTNGITFKGNSVAHGGNFTGFALSSGQVTTALGFTPYSATNPSGYITSSALSSYLPLSGGTLSGNLTVSGGDVFLRSNKWIYFQHTAGGEEIRINNSSAGHLDVYSQTNARFADVRARNFVMADGSVVLHSGNYNSYSPTLTGTGASGTWGISISGSAAQLGGNSSSAYSGPNSTIKQFFWNDLSASGTQARTFEIARLGIDFNDWNTGTGPFEVELFEDYYSRGLKKKYVISWGYTNSSSIQLVEYSGSGDNNFQCRIGTPVQVSGDNYYLPVFVDVKYYSRVDVRVTTNRDITSSNPPAIGTTFINASPSATNISDFTADSTVNFASTTAVQISGNQLLHAGNYSSYALPLSGGTMTGTLSFQQPVGLSFANGQYIKDNGGGGLVIYSGAAVNINHASGLTSNGNTILHAGNYSSYALPLSGGTVTGVTLIKRNLGTNDYTNTGQHNLHLRLQRASDLKTLELGVLDNGTGVIQANESGVGYQTLALNPVSGAVTANGNQVLHAGNYSSYALPLSGGTLTGDLRFNNGGAGRIAFTDNYHGMILRGHPSDAAGTINVTDVTSLVQHSGDFRFYRTNGSINEVYFQVNATAPYWRGNTILHAGNYTSYSPSLTGSGASGTWGINITGNAATATSATDSTKLPLSGGTVTGSTTFNSAVVIGGRDTRYFENDSFIEFYVAGDANTYYPVRFSPSVWFHFARWSISRGYADTAPWDPIGTGVHRGGLTLTWEWSGDGAWGGNDKTIRVSQFSEQYTTMVGGLALSVNGIIVWLRGGNAYYRFHGPGGVMNGVTQYYSTFTASDGSTYSPRSYNSGTVASEVTNRMPVRGVAELYDGGNRVLHAGNYSSYALPLSGGTVTGNLAVNGVVRTGWHGGNAYDGGSGASLYFGGDTGGAYRLWTSFENVGGNYTKLNIDWHTGIRIGAYWAYGGIRFYNDALGYGSANGYGNKVFSVAEGDSHVRVYNNLYVGGNLALHAGNYTSYSPSLTGGGASGTWGINITGNSGSASSVAWGNVTSRPSWLTSASLVASHANANEFRNSGFYENDGGGSNWPSGTWYNSINVRHSNQGNYHGFQIAMSYYDNNLWFRSYQGQGTFQSWAVALSSQNYNSYSPTLTGGGASGTWGINITGESRSVNLGGTGHTITSSSWAGGGGYHGYTYSGGNFRFGFSSTGGVVDVYADGNFYATDSSHLVLHAGNYSSYALPLSGGSMTGNISGPAYNSPNFIRFASDNNWAYGCSYDGGSQYWMQVQFYGTGDDTRGFRVLDKNGDAVRFRVNGAGNVTASGNVTAYSDERLKKDWSLIESGFVDRLAVLRCGTYTRIDSGQRQAGVSAQNMREILPEVVSEDSDGTLALAYGNAALVSAVELAKEIVNLKREIEMLKTKLH